MLSHEQTSGREERIGEIIASWLDLLKQGDSPSPEEVLARHPQFEKELREFFENDALVRDAFKPSNGAVCFGDDYEVLGEIGRGGMGIVYKCHQKSLDKIVAIKTITGGPLATQNEIERIWKEAQKAASLHHPNIVTVHQIGEYQGRHFFVMEYIEGQSLADLIRSGPLPPAKAAHYVKTIAEAIHYAHQRQILHCDVKPANILVDEEGKPYVTDFGLSRRLGEGAKYLLASALGGTPEYMAPEQAASGELTTTTDVYGLGATLYTLLTGHPPFQLTGEPPFHVTTLLGLMKQVRGEDPKRPNERNPSVDRDLDAICMKCLNKDRDGRYRSAYGLTRDLAQYQAGEETTARVWDWKEQTIGWRRRNPLVAGLISAVILTSIMAVVMAVSIVDVREDDILQETLQSNSFAARDLAQTALLQLRDLGRAVELAARDTTLSGLLERGDVAGLGPYLQQMCSPESIVFASCSVMAAAGVQLARFAPGELNQLTPERFNWRDYFQGATMHSGQEGRRSVHVSKVYLSRNDDLYKFAISAPILGEDGQFLGVIVSGVTTDAAMGLVDLEDDRRTVALMAPRDTDQSDSPVRPDAAVILFHPAYEHGVRAVEFERMNPMPAIREGVHYAELDDSEQRLPADDDYADPVGYVESDYEGRWIAGFAPVGSSGFVVIVQEPYEEALALDLSTLRNFILGSAMIMLLTVTAVAVVLSRWVRQRSPV